jgi:hypothetical protein
MKTMNRLPLFLILAGFAAPARAAFTAEIPGLKPLPAAISGAAAPSALALTAMPLSPLLPSVSLPAPSLPVAFPRNLPGAWNHLPVELPAEAAVPVPRPKHDEYHLDWSFLDGGHDVAHVASPVGPAPLPLPPSGAHAQLVYVGEVVAHEAREVADVLFDGARAVVSAR